MPVLAFVVPTGSSAVSLASSASALTAIALPDLSDIAQQDASSITLPQGLPDLPQLEAEPERPPKKAKKGE